MSEEKNELVFRICPNDYMTPGYAMLLLAPIDYEKFAERGYSLKEMQPGEFDNKIKFQIKMKAND